VNEIASAYKTGLAMTFFLIPAPCLMGPCLQATGIRAG